MEIIDIIPIDKIADWPFITILICVAVAFASVIIAIVHGKNDTLDVICVIIFITAAVAMVVLFVLILCGVFDVHDYDKLVVRIDDDFPLSKIYEQYKILDKEKYSNVYYLKELIK